MNDIDYQQVIKWVLIVIVAGFLGQFGKSFATYLIERAKRKKALAALEKSDGPIEQSTLPASAPETAEAEGKAMKKAMKALIKLKKKRE